LSCDGWASWGRRQPYAAHPSQLKQQHPGPARVNEPQHTFFQHNADNTTPGPNWRVAPRNYPPFDWLVHLDRELISPMELLHVSAFKPHELTQQFRTGDEETKKFNHRAPWLDDDLPVGQGPPQSHRLYRALEFLGTHSRILGMMTASTTSPQSIPPTPTSPQGSLPAGPFANQKVTPAAMSGTTASGGTWRIEVGCTLVIDRGRIDPQGRSMEEVVRVNAAGPDWFRADFLKPHGANFTITPNTISERVPGRINLNTVWDEETFLALCDRNQSNHFSDGAVKNAFRRLLASRTKGGAPGPGDRPFRSLAAGMTKADDGIHDTLLRFDNPNSPTRRPLLVVEGEHPYQKFELLTKIANNVTVRSNVFAVWITVGFFEVTDETSRPVKLGAELGRAEGRQVRHRMFAIVDRSIMTGNPGPQPRFDPRAPAPAMTTGRVVPHYSVID
jgi:hypothetical protein